MLFFYISKNERIYLLAGVLTDFRVIFFLFSLFSPSILAHFSFDECLMTCFEIYFRLKNSTYLCIYYLIYFIGGNLQELLICHLEFL